jgi:hypothetical protein
MSSFPTPAPVTYRVSDFYALTMRSWRLWTAMFTVIFLLLVLIPIALVLAEGYDLRTARHFIDWQFAAGMTLFLLAVIAVTVPLKYWLAKRRGLFEPTTFVAGDDGLEISSSRITSKVSWKAVSKIETAHGRTFLFLAPRLAFIIPRRAFASEAEFADWTEAVRRAGANAAAGTMPRA